MKIYIAGRISNNPHYLLEFKRAEIKITHLGHTPLNPVKNDGFEYKEYIDMGLCELSKCDAILMLTGWEMSLGARLERQYANTVGLQVFHSIEDIPND